MSEIDFYGPDGAAGTARTVALLRAYILEELSGVLRDSDLDEEDPKTVCARECVRSGDVCPYVTFVCKGPADGPTGLSTFMKDAWKDLEDVQVSYCADPEEAASKMSQLMKGCRTIVAVTEGRIAVRIYHKYDQEALLTRWPSEDA